MNIKYEGKDVTDFVTAATWSGADTQCSRTLEFSVMYDPYTKYIAVPDMKLGGRISLHIKEKVIFVGELMSRERSGEMGTISYRAMDFMHHLLRSKASKNYKDTTAEKIAMSLCSAFQIKTRNIAKTNINIKKLLPRDESIYDIIMAAYKKAAIQTKKKYMLCIEQAKVSVIEKGENSGVILKQDHNITGSFYEENIENMINKVAIYDDKGKQIDEIKNADWIKRYGIYQESYTKEEGINAKIAAQRQMQGIAKNASVEALGNINAISGYSIQMKDTATKLTGKYWITSDEHTWENGVHTMSLELTFKNLMEEIEVNEVNEDEETKKSGNAGKSQNETINKVTELAKTFIGKVKYNMGSSTPQNGISDCSGYTQYCFKKAAGIEIGRTTNNQVRYGEKVNKSELKIGDLVMFKNTYNSGYHFGVSHVGIYVGQNNFIHCSSSGVKISGLRESYWTEHWLMGRRVIK